LHFNDNQRERGEEREAAKLFFKKESEKNGEVMKNVF
jgi:hypothetical protein